MEHQPNRLSRTSYLQRFSLAMATFFLSIESYIFGSSLSSTFSTLKYRHDEHPNQRSQSY